MSMYNMLCRNNPKLPHLLETLGLTPEDFCRIRDGYQANGEIAIFTRCGGGNREAHKEMFDKMKAHPNYLRDEDWPDDNTYCTIYFSYPVKEMDELKDMEDIIDDTPSEKMKEALEGIRGIPGLTRSGKPAETPAEALAGAEA